MTEILPEEAVEIQPWNRERWLQDRKTSVGASEAWDAVLGDSLRLWAIKRGLLEPDPPTFRMKMGLLLEPVMCELYKELTGVPIACRQIFRRDPSRPYVSATADAIAENGTLVEFKTVDPADRDTIDRLESDRLPDRWLCQTEQQMQVFEREEMDLFVLIGLRDRMHIPLHRNATLANVLLGGIERFWECVETGVRPAARTRDLDVLKALHPTCEGFTILSDVEAEKAAQYLALGRAIRDLERSRDEIKCDLLAAMGSAATAEAGPLSLRRHEVTVRQPARAASVSKHVRLTVKEGS